MEKISIIVPVYNGRQKIRRCVDSIINQTYPSIEIILVDDGSKDGSAQICDEYEERYKNVKVIHKNNGGVSSARNIGLKYATGEYIGFVDSDDYVESNMFQIMIEEINGFDLVMCGYYQDEKKHIGVPYNQGVSKEEAIRNIIGSGPFKGFPWNKLFRKSIIEEENITFQTDIHMCEDLLFCVEYINKSKNISLISEALYHYDNTNENGASNGGFNPKKLSVIEAYKRLLEVDIIRCNTVSYNIARWTKIRHCLSLWNELRKSQTEEKKIFTKIIIQEIIDAKWDFLSAKEYSIKYKMLFILLKFIKRGKI